MESKVVVFGASPNSSRFSYKATRLLNRYNYKVIPLGLRKGNIDGIEILTGNPHVEDVDTVTLYVGPQRQPDIIDFIISLKPRRIVFNPGTENYEFYAKAKANNIEVVEDCTLVMLNSGTF